MGLITGTSLLRHIEREVMESLGEGSFAQVRYNSEDRTFSKPYLSGKFAVNEKATTWVSISCFQIDLMATSGPNSIASFIEAAIDAAWQGVTIT